MPLVCLGSAGSSDNSRGLQGCVSVYSPGAHYAPLHLLCCCRQASLQAAKQLVGAAVGVDGLQLLMNNAGVGMVAPVEFFPLDEFRWDGNF